MLTASTLSANVAVVNINPLEGFPMQAAVTTWKIAVPWSLVWFRGAVAPVMVWWAIQYDWRWFLGALMVTAFLSDWFDGVLARRWNTSTAALRRADSLADTVFYVNVLVAGMVARWNVIEPVLPWFAGLIGLEVVCQVTNYARFGCRTATHAYLCKAWAIVLCIAATDLLMFHAVRESMWVCLAMGYLAYVDVLAILWIMPVPAVDVPTSLHAWRLRAKSLSLQPDSGAN
jgi:CDP-diacylglycerol--glycerol-3-phosphate 3-phosphatidyltransferase